MSNPLVCGHGRLRRQCDSCELIVAEKQLEAADALGKAAKKFDSIIHCYQTGVVTLLEEDVKLKHEELMSTLAAYEKIRGMK